MNDEQGASFPATCCTPTQNAKESTTSHNKLELVACHVPGAAFHRDPPLKRYLIPLLCSAYKILYMELVAAGSI
jgi:hypothetical protein